jgi:hypothetical protein
MSLSALPALNVAQNSLFNELAQINNSVTANAANSTVLASSPQGSAAASDPSSSGGSSTDPLANDLATLLKSLGSGDVNAAKAALTKVEADLKADTSSASSQPSNSSTESATSSQSSNPLSKLLQQLGTALNSGDTQGALQDLSSFLLSTGQASGSAVNVSV